MRANEQTRSWMEPYAPPGAPLLQEKSYWIMTMIISTFWCLQYVLRYIEARNMLFEYRVGRKVLIEGAMMTSFESLTANLFEVFGLVLLYCVLVVVYHYFYHYQGSNMMYLMRRLPNKWELHTRCFVLPIMASIFTIAYMYVLRMLFLAIYILCTPSQCLVL